MTTMSRAPRGRGVPAGLTRELVLDAAEQVIDAQGFDAMSIRTIASRLGVSPAAIYNHIFDRSELIDGVADAFVARELLADLPAVAPIELVRTLGIRLYRAAVKHPGLMVAVVGHRPERMTAQHEFGELLIEAVIEAGGDEAAAQLVYRTFVSLTGGLALSIRNVERESKTPFAQRVEQQRAASRRPDAARILNSMPGLTDPAAWEAQLALVMRAIPAQITKEVAS